MTERGFSQFDHTADLALEIRAESEAGLLEEGGRAIVSLLTDGAALEPNAERRVRLESLDREDRLVQWLNEVLVLALTQGFVTVAAKVTLDGTALDAILRGQDDAADKIVTELKSVTYHELSITPGPDGWTARVIIDV